MIRAISIAVALLPAATQAQGIADLAPCLVPQETVADYVAPFAELGWTQVTTGAAHQRSLHGAGEMHFALLSVPRAFEDAAAQATYLTRARDRATRNDMPEFVAHFVRDDWNLRVEYFARPSAQIACLITARALPALDGADLRAVTLSGAPAVVSFQRLDPGDTGLLTDAHLDAISLDFPFDTDPAPEGRHGFMLTGSFDQ